MEMQVWRAAWSAKSLMTQTKQKLSQLLDLVTAWALLVNTIWVHPSNARGKVVLIDFFTFYA